MRVPPRRSRSKEGQSRRRYTATDPGAPQVRGLVLGVAPRQGGLGRAFIQQVVAVGQVDSGTVAHCQGNRVSAHQASAPSSGSDSVQSRRAVKVTPSPQPYPSHKQTQHRSVVIV
jgi:hypothetical protein